MPVISAAEAIIAIAFSVCNVVPLALSHAISAFLLKTDYDEIWGKQSLPPTDELVIFWEKLYQGQGSRTRQKIRIDVKPVLPRSE